MFGQLDALAATGLPLEAPVIVQGNGSEMLTRGFANLTGRPSNCLPYGPPDSLPADVELSAALGQHAGLFSTARYIMDSAAA